jgi:hypothetical protein
MKKCMIKTSDVYVLTDAFFSPAPDGKGWVMMEANGHGMACVNALFPKAHIAWRHDKVEGVPDDWRGFAINLPDAAAATEHKLPLEITKGMPLETIAAESLGFLLAMAVSKQGARAGFWDNGTVNIVQPHSANN